MGYVAIDKEVEDVTVDNYGDVKYLRDGNREWVVFQNREEAGEAARDYYLDMAKNDPEEFACMVGEKTLVAWGLGQMAGPGYVAVRNLQEWCDLYLDLPEEHFGSYDGTEYEGTVSLEVMEELGFAFKEVVFYRHN